MERGLYIAASGMVAEMARQDQIANDLANASTPGYKADRAAQSAFGQLMVTNSRSGETVGTISAGTRIDRQATDMRPQPSRETGEPLDMAIEGEGYFTVQTPEGVRYTRNGSFRAGPGGTLVDQLGNPVLGRGGGPVRVGADGRVAGDQVATVAVPNARKAGNGLFTGQAAGPGGPVQTGALESSGVDPARTMVDMMASLRAFEAGQKVITTIDETLDRAAGQVGSMGR